ncbi:hypothetical protein EDB89DRAFT_2004486 [Lactarius sanguifluus]|nr:hypothetical protein EDB89DRAFT_2004486 [Lactarius sanguifluus]
MILAILASLYITISHSSLYCFTSWRPTHQSIVRGNVCNTYIPHDERLKQETRDGCDKWELGCQGTPLLESCERSLNCAHRNIAMRADGSFASCLACEKTDLTTSSMKSGGSNGEKVLRTPPKPASRNGTIEPTERVNRQSIAARRRFP